MNRNLEMLFVEIYGRNNDDEGEIAFYSSYIPRIGEIVELDGPDFIDWYGDDIRGKYKVEDVDYYVMTMDAGHSPIITLKVTPL